MKQCLLIAVALMLSAGAPLAQTFPASRTPTPKAAPPVRQGATFELSEYGVEFQADPRLIVVMAALEAAGFQPVPPGREPSAFRSKVRKDLTDLDPELRSRLRTFYERNLLPAPATAADQASRYVTLALALTPPPELEPPTRSEDLPAGLLEVLDFAPLVREFYRRSGIDSKLTTYVRDYRLEGDRLREPTTELVRSILTYLHTTPMTSTVERVEVKSPSTKKKSSQAKSYSK